jgi:hypothetical protein
MNFGSADTIVKPPGVGEALAGVLERAGAPQCPPELPAPTGCCSEPQCACQALCLIDLSRLVPQGPSG